MKNTSANIASTARVEWTPTAAVEKLIRNEAKKRGKTFEETAQELCSKALKEFSERCAIPTEPVSFHDANLHPIWYNEADCGRESGVGFWNNAMVKIVPLGNSQVELRPCTLRDILERGLKIHKRDLAQKDGDSENMIATNTPQYSSTGMAQLCKLLLEKV